MNPIRIPAFIARGIAEYVVDNTIAAAEAVQFALILKRPR